MDARKLLRIARWEVARNAGGLDRRTGAVLALALLATGVVGGVAVAGNAGVESGIYRVGVAEDSGYHQPAVDDSLFVVREPSVAALATGDVELLADRFGVDPGEGTKARAAHAEFRGTVSNYNDRLMREEPNATAAYPVSVTLTYAEQSGGGTTLDSVDAGDGSDEGSGDGSGSGADGGTASGDGATGRTGATDGTGASGSGDAAGSSGGIGGFGAQLTGGASTGAPSDIAPPFPFESLVLAFLYVVPLNFVIQAYGSSMLSERLNRRGELLLVSPVTRTDVIAGKTLPYFAGAAAVVAAITAGLRFSGLAPSGSAVAVLAVLPLVALFLGATFCGAMFARSFKELTFVTVTVTVSLTSYAFVPAIFTDVTPIALISPLTVVVRDLQGEAIGLGEFAFSTAPPTLTALVCFGLGAGLYREEDMFTQRSVPAKVLDALSGQIASPRSAGKLSMFLLPFVFVAELLAVALLFPLYASGGALVPILLLVAVVAVEEVAKSIHVYAGFAQARYEATLRSALVVGAFSGLGFFVAEKFVAIGQLVQLDDIEAGQAAFGTGGLVPEGLPLGLVLAALLLAPLVLHVVTAAVSAVGASRGKRQYVVALGVAMAVHFAYNLTVVSTLGV